MSKVPRKCAVVLTHAPFEGPGIIADVLRARGYTVELRALYDGDSVPTELPSEDVLVVMGGSMGVGDVGGSEYPFLDAELRLLERRATADAPVLGVCLGAQLLAAAAGAKVYGMTRPDGSRLYEVGWAPVQFTSNGLDDALLSGIPQSAPVLHWHGDTFELPRGARGLASSALCENQAFLLGSSLFGLQFHCEVTRTEVEAFTDSDGPFIELANGPGYVEQLRRDTAQYVEGAVRLGRRLIENVVNVMESSIGRGP